MPRGAARPRRRCSIARLPPISAAITCGALHAQAEPNIVQKIFAMPLIGGGKGVELGSEYEL